MPYGAKQFEGTCAVIAGQLRHVAVFFRINGGGGTLINFRNLSNGRTDGHYTCFKGHGLEPVCLSGNYYSIQEFLEAGKKQKGVSIIID